MRRMRFFAARWLLTVLPISSAAIAQDSLSWDTSRSGLPDSALTVQSIVINGNTRTKDFVILREMSIHSGSRVTERMLEYDQNRIYSLGLFNQVQLRVAPQSDTNVILHVEVNERWYLFPFPVFGFQDRDPAKVFYGLGVLHNNFRGRNEKVFATLVLGYNPSVRLSYRNPFVNDDGTTFLEAGLGASKVRNRSTQAQTGIDNFDEKHLSFSFTIGKRLGLYHTLWLSASYDIVDITDVTPVKTLSADGIDRYPIAAVGYTYDTRDLREYPAYGLYLHGGITKYGVPGETVDIVRYEADVRGYVALLTDVVLTGRTFTNLAAAGPTPGYNRVYFGYAERVRGHFRDIMEGESIFGVSSEIHHTLFSPVFMSITFLPSGFNVWKFGVTAAAFADAGTVWFRGQPVTVANFVAGYGVGLHFLLPYSTVIRTEYAWNELRRGEFVLGIGSSF